MKLSTAKFCCLVRALPDGSVKELAVSRLVGRAILPADPLSSGSSRLERRLRPGLAALLPDQLQRVFAIQLSQHAIAQPEAI